MKKNKLLIIAMSPVGNGFSGGDRIFVELAKHAVPLGIKTEVLTWKDGMAMCKRGELTTENGVSFQILSIGWFENAGFFLCYIGRIIHSILWAFTYSIPKEVASSLVVYSSSDFWMDVLPSFILKQRFQQITWVGTFYLAAPNPFVGYREGGSIKFPTLKGIAYWLLQQPMYALIKKYCAFIFITSLPDAKRFPLQNQQGNIVIIKGGVDLLQVKKFQEQIGKVKKIYDAAYLGRFHPQKGVLELINIWAHVVKKKTDARLVMIGDGSLMQEVKANIEKYGLQNNVILAGYLPDGIKKYTYFAKSKIAVHPAIYDSGGMSAAEIMAWELPAVSFDLEALKTYYPKGMIKVPIGKNDVFSEKILALLSEKTLYEETKKDAIDLVKQEWDWNKRAKESLQTIMQ